MNESGILNVTKLCSDSTYFRGGKGYRLCGVRSQSPTIRILFNFPLFRIKHSGILFEVDEWGSDILFNSRQPSEAVWTITNVHSVAKANSSIISIIKVLLMHSF